ncbi:MAG: SDR family oxidoreductase [SAR324 cluster bacterium]|nr:SDR family oxidoreductase [SAR324 cluster bacterium]
MSQTILITGTSSGIGKAAVRHFQSKGWNVAATMRTPEKETELTTLPNVECIHLDVTVPESVRDGIARAIKRFGKIDAVVNNAGYGLIGAFELATHEQIKRQFETNVLGVMDVTQAILPHFRENRSGTIVNVASLSGRVSFPLFSLYHATKWAVEGFSESLQHELKPFNIHMKIIEPGIVKTEFDGSSKDMTHSDTLQAYDKYVNKIIKRIMGFYRWGTTAEHVAEVIFKATTDSSSRLRYSVGIDANMLLLLRRFVPDSIFNGTINKSLTL